MIETTLLPTHDRIHEPACLGASDKPMVSFGHDSEMADDSETPTQESTIEEESAGIGEAGPMPLDADVRYHDAYRLYLREIGPIKLLSAHEEIDLARRIQGGDGHAREQMITANLKLVVKIAHDFEGAGLSLLDLIAEGNMGLMKAVERFDPDRGTRLASYAAFWIKQHMRRAISNQSRTIRLPVHIHDRLWQISRAITRLRELLGRAPTDEEIAEEIKVPAAKVGRLRETSQSALSLDASLGADDSDELGAIIADENAVRPDERLDDEESRSRLESCLQTLHPREKAVLQERFGLDGHDDHTLEEVGDKFGLTRERIRQIQNRALGKLRTKMLARSTRSVAA